MKNFLKKVITKFYCFVYKVKYVEGLYMGLGCKVVGSQRVIICGGGVKIMPQAMIVAHPEGRIEIGENSEISMYSRVAATRYVKIGNNVLTGPHVFICDYNHEYRDVSKPIMRQGRLYNKEITDAPLLEIGDGSWLGTNVVVAGNVRIGRNCVIGANSVVTHDIPDYCVAAGIPAKVIKKYNSKSLNWERIR